MADLSGSKFHSKFTLSDKFNILKMKQRSDVRGKSNNTELLNTSNQNNINKNLTFIADIPLELLSTAKLSDEMISFREKIKDELIDIEKKIYELETFYWNQTTDIGNMLRGWDGYTSCCNTPGSIGNRKSTISVGRNSCKSANNIFSEKDRWFSLSSVTSPVDVEFLDASINTGALTEVASATGSNADSILSRNSESQFVGSETDNTVNNTRKRK